MPVLTFDLTAEEPLLMTSLQGDPNSSVSFAYIPGSAIRGALIGRYIAQEKRRQPDFTLDPTDNRVRALFFHATTRFLNAYPVIAHEDLRERSLPLPRSWFQKKYDAWTEGTKKELKGHDYSRKGHQELDNRKPFGGGEYCWLWRSEEPLVVSVERYVNIHNQRDRKKGRGVKESGAVFRYESIAPEQTFRAAILFDAKATTQDDIALIHALLDANKTLWIGGSRSAGYGRVAISEVTMQKDLWSETEQPVANRLPGQSAGTLTLSLLSDMVVRDTYGQYTTEFPLDEVARLLGVSLTLERSHSFQAATLHGGFNRTWGLPLPQTPALAAGSVLVCQLGNGTIPNEAAVSALEWRGLGERRAEGFGRVAVNWHPDATFTAQKPEPWQDETAPKELSSEGKAMVRTMAERMLRQKLDIALEKLVERNKITSDPPSNTQLSRLRIVARRALSDDQGLESIKQLLEKQPQNARDQFSKAGIGSIRLDRWLTNRVKNYHTDWQGIDPVELAGVSVAIDDTLAREYTLRLIMAVARQAVKEVQE
jgi:CRISPR-associated protein Csx10